MNRGMVVKFVLGGLLTLAVADAAQAQIFRRRAWRNDCCCDGYYGYSNRGMGYGYGGGYAYNMPMYTNSYVNNCWCQPIGTMMASGGTTTPYVSGYGDPNSMSGGSALPSGSSMHGGSLTNDKTRLRVEVPTAETKIWVDQHQVQSTGTQRSIDMPITSTSPQKVTVTAQWWKDGREVVRKKEVDIRGGQEATVTFTDSDAGMTGEQLPTNPTVPDLNRSNPDKP